MIRLAFIALITATMLTADGVDRWRAGDRAYRTGAYEEAVQAYTEALASMAPDNPRRYRVQSNLGAALYALGRHEDAREAYRGATEFARGNSERARAAYNAGTISLEMADYRAALQHLRESVIADQSNEDAKHNLELALRQTPPEDESGSMMPSDEASGAGDDEQDERQSDGEVDDDPDGEDDAEGDPGDDGDDGDDGDVDADQESDAESSDEDGADRSDSAPAHEPALSKEQAERILQALESGEQEALRHVRQTDAPQRRIEKDW